MCEVSLVMRGTRGKNNRACMRRRRPNVRKVQRRYGRGHRPRHAQRPSAAGQVWRLPRQKVHCLLAHLPTARCLKHQHPFSQVLNQQLSFSLLTGATKANEVSKGLWHPNNEFFRVETPIPVSIAFSGSLHLLRSGNHDDPSGRQSAATTTLQS